MVRAGGDDHSRVLERLEAAAREIRHGAGEMGTLQRDVDRLLETVIGVDGVVPQMVRLQSELVAVRENCTRIQTEKREQCALAERRDAGRWRIIAQLAGSGAVGAAAVKLLERWTQP